MCLHPHLGGWFQTKGKQFNLSEPLLTHLPKRDHEDQLHYLWGSVQKERGWGCFFIEDFKMAAEKLRALNQVQGPSEWVSLCDR